MLGKEKASLAAQIQRDVVDSGVPISDVLRKAKILASRLKNAEFKRWVDAELSGYDSAADIPDYRKFQTLNLGTYVGHFARATNVQIPVSPLPDRVREFAERAIVRQGVKEIETLAGNETKGKFVRLPWPPDVVLLARDHVEMQDGSTLVEAWKPLSKGQLAGILDQIRNRLLDFLLELEQIKPDVMESEDAIRAVPSSTVQSVFNTTILGGPNIVATGTDFTQKVSQGVKVGDTQSLCDHFWEPRTPRGRARGTPRGAYPGRRTTATEVRRRR